MSVPSKNAKLGPSTEATTSKLLERAQSSLARCLILLDNIDGPYFYEAIGSSIIPGSLSNLLCITDTQLMAIYQSCGYEAIGTASIPGSLSHLLCVRDKQLMTIYRYCGLASRLLDGANHSNICVHVHAI
jgi:hypothetical protein